jgi:uncharacterized protein (TIGR03086 family)
MTAMVDLTPAARRLSELVRHIDDDQLGAPIPSDIRVADMLDHVGGLAVAFAAAAAKDLGSVTATPPAPDGDRLGIAWRTEIPGALTALAQAWTDPAAWEGMTQVGGVTLPGEIAGQVALDEVVLHAWDLARHRPAVPAGSGHAGSLPGRHDRHVPARQPRYPEGHLRAADTGGRRRAAR